MKGLTTVMNLSHHILSDEELETLSLGMNFALPPTKFMENDLKLQFTSTIESHFESSDIEEIEKEILRQNICNLIKNGKMTSNLSKVAKIIKQLTSNNEIVILKADKGNCTTLIMDILFVPQKNYSTFTRRPI